MQPQQGTGRVVEDDRVTVVVASLDRREELLGSLAGTVHRFLLPGALRRAADVLDAHSGVAVVAARIHAGPHHVPDLRDLLRHERELPPGRPAGPAPTTSLETP